MKNVLKYGFAALSFTLIFGVFAFTTNTTGVQNEEVFNCTIYKAELTSAKWNEIAAPHGYEYIIGVTDEVVGYQDHIITTSDYSGNWEALMICLELPTSTLSFGISDEVGGY